MHADRQHVEMLVGTQAGRQRQMSRETVITLTALVINSNYLF